MIAPTRLAGTMFIDARFIMQYRAACPVPAINAQYFKACRGGLLMAANPVPAMAANIASWIMSVIMSLIVVGQNILMFIIRKPPVSPRAIHPVSSNALMNRLNAHR